MRSLKRIFALLSWCSSVCPSGTGVHCDHMVHVGADLSLWLDSPMFWAPWHQSMSTNFQPSFSTSALKRGAWINTNEAWYLKNGWRQRLSYYWVLTGSRIIPSRLAQQRTLGDLKWPFHASRAISAVDELYLYWARLRTVIVAHCLRRCRSACVITDARQPRASSDDGTNTRFDSVSSGKEIKV